MNKSEENVSAGENTQKEVSDWDSTENLESAKADPNIEGHGQIGPFGIEYVDPLVFHNSNDIPELRASATKIPYFATLEIKEPAPVKPSKRKYTEWIPGRVSSTRNHGQEILAVKSFSSKLRFFFGILIVLTPIALIIFIVKLGLSLYEF